MTRLSNQVGGIVASIGVLFVLAKAAFGRGHDRKEKTAGADCKGSGLTASSNPTKTAGVACKGSYPTASSNGDSTIEDAKKGDGAVMAAQEDALAMEKDHGDDAAGQELEAKEASSGGKDQQGQGQEGKKGKEQWAPDGAVKAGLMAANKRVQLQKREPVAAQADALAKKDQGHDAVGREAEAKEAGSGGKDQQGQGQEGKKGKEQSAPGGTIKAGLMATSMRVQLQRERQIRVLEEASSWAASSSRIYREKFEVAQADLKESKKRCSELGKEVDELKEKVVEVGYDVDAWKAVVRKLRRRLALKSRVVSVGVVRCRKARAAARAAAWAAGQDVASDAEGQEHEAEVVDQEVVVDEDAEASEGAESEAEESAGLEDEQSEAEAGMVDEAEASDAEAEQEGQQDQEEEDEQEEQAGGGGPVVRTLVLHKYAEQLVRITEEVEEGEAGEALRACRAGLRCTSHPLQDMEEEDDEQDE